MTIKMMIRLRDVRNWVRWTRAMRRKTRRLAMAPAREGV